MSRGLAAKVSHATIEGAVAGAVSLHEVPRSCAAQDCGDRSRAFPALEMGGEEGVVAREELVEDRIGFVAIGLDVDEQDESCFVRIDITPISTCALGQGSGSGSQMRPRGIFQVSRGSLWFFYVVCLRSLVLGAEVI